MSGFCVAGSVLRLVGSLTTTAVGAFWASRRSTGRFRRTLLRAGLSAEAADDLTTHYAENMSLRGWLRSACETARRGK